MKLLKSFSISFFILLSLVLVTPIFAEVTSVAQTSNQFIIANTSIQNTKITSEKGNLINISFDIQNGSGAQAGIKYSVRLTDKSGNTVDEYVYPEKISLGSNSSITKSVVYNAPNNLNGEYSAFIQIKNEGNIILGMGDLGKIKLSSSVSIVDILSKTCYLSVVGEKSSPKYTLSQIVDINQSEQLNINCTVSNSSKKDITVTPSYQTNIGNIYGDIVSTTSGDVKPIAFKSGEKKIISLALPKANAPQIYSTKVSFKSGDTYSNYIILYYRIQGVSATVKSFSLDKDIYKKGDTANISLIWSHSPLYTNSRVKVIDNTKDNQGDPVISLNISILNDNQKDCIDPINKKLDYYSDGLVLPATIITDCSNPQTNFELKDSNGVVLYNKQLSFVSSPNSLEEVKQNSFINRLLTTTNILIAIGVILALGIIVYLINLKKKDQNINNDLNKSNETTI